MKTQILDFAGKSIALTVQNDKVYYAGMPVDELIKDDSNNGYSGGGSSFRYIVHSNGFILGKITLKDSDFEAINELLNPIDFTRVNNDTNGNPRAVCHFLEFIHPSENLSLDEKYNVALFRSRQLGGRKFHNKQYGGGIVFQMYRGEDSKMSAKIREIRNSFAVKTT